MAFVPAVSSVVDLPGTPGLTLIFGSFAQGGGDSGGDIDLSTVTNNSGQNITGVVRIMECVVVTSTASGSEPRVTIAYSSTTDRDVVTLATAADQDGRFIILGSRS